MRVYQRIATTRLAVSAKVSLWLHEAAVSRMSGACAVPQGDEQVTQHRRGVMFEDASSDFFFTSHLWLSDL